MSGYIDDFLLVYLDDILIYSDNADEHEAHLRLVFDRLRKHKLQAKLKKCEFGKPYVKYLGHVVVLVNCMWILTRWLLSSTGSHLKILRVCSSS